MGNISIDLPSACTQQPPWDSCHDLTSYNPIGPPLMFDGHVMSNDSNGKWTISYFKKKWGTHGCPNFRQTVTKPSMELIYDMMLSPHTISTLEGHRRQLIHAMKPSAATYWHIIYYQYVMKFSNIIMQWGNMVNWQTNMIQLLIVLLTLCKFMYCQT